MAEEIVSRREQIMTELRRRLSLVYPDSQIDRGFYDEAVSTYDHFYVFDLPEQLNLDNRGRGMYKCAFPISISYWIQSDPENMFTVGNYHLEKIRLALELDERFGSPERIQGLCTGYYLDEGALLWYDEGVLDIEFIYVFEYTKDAGWVKNPFAPSTQGGS
jgi:hypothetical protein